jgi:hypothetical protein
MAALLIGLAVMLVLMSVAMPVWRHEAQREKEAELVFRGQQYARAVGLYSRKMGGGNFPPSVDVLVQQRFLRKKYKDPMTADGEFDLITGGAAVPGQNPQPGGRGAPASGIRQPPQSRPSPSMPGVGAQGQPVGILGVRSKSKEASIRVYNGGTHYNEWAFVFSNISNRPGGAGGAGRPGGPGGRGVDGPGGGRGSGPGGRGLGFPGRGPGQNPPPGMPMRGGGPG